MELQTARQIIDTLARGVHPVTGECMPADSPYNEPPVIRALFTVSKALEDVPARAARTPRVAPPNAGKPWAPEDDATLENGFDAGTEAKELAAQLGRTRFAVEARLAALGKLPQPAGMRFPVAAAR
ncbi:hypothetical protein [Caenimonas aquaedulcis]|uniref:Uncharacterized protein n=1 Tax=Caenimonas aquaedulcis TaxID=2793270 RepID=A0A931H3C2_9BURK|nr:hypothetical protein [Caenimonas aquaedulcis]MBG9387820.1 hypothetical protein [Caenimonas aquaedulcis]